MPYFILLILIGIPLFFLELAVGQRIRRGSIGVWNYVYPQLGGIGVSSLMVGATPSAQIPLDSVKCNAVTFIHGTETLVAWGRASSLQDDMFFNFFIVMQLQAMSWKISSQRAKRFYPKQLAVLFLTYMSFMSRYG